MGKTFRKGKLIGRDPAASNECCAATAYIFIVPNKCSVIDFESTDKLAEYNNAAIQRINKQYANLGADPKFQFVDGDIPVQVWIHDECSDNWQDHKLPAKLRTDDGGKYAPSYIPARLLMGVKEGDSFEMIFNGHTVVVTANQLDYRYGRFGSFESVVALMTRE